MTTATNIGTFRRHPRVWLGCVFCVMAALGLILYFFNPTQSSFYPTCMFHRMTGLNCPGCGSLRAMHLLTHGHILTALRFNPLLILSLPILAYYGLRFLFRGPGEGAFPSMMIRPKWIAGLFIVLVVFAILRNIPFAPFTYLGPP
jgi:hypothetical protein